MLPTQSDIVLPPFRRPRRSRTVRRPIIVQREILPRPQPGSVVTSVTSSRNVKVMNPSDMRSVTVRNVVEQQPTALGWKAHYLCNN